MSGMARRHEDIQEVTTATSDVLADPNWLADHLDDRTVRVIEVDITPAAYTEGHITGAVLWNVFADLKDGDYQLVGAEAIADLFARCGITPDTTVVLYGHIPAIGFWLMRYYRHTDVRILDCARRTWRDRGLPWTADAPQPERTDYPLPAPDTTLRADLNYMRAALGDPAMTILDVRTADEYAGGRFWPSGGMEPGGRTGHIPGAVHAPIDGIYTDDGAFRSPADLRTVFAAADLDGGGELIPYCTIGGRASTAWFVLSQLLDRPNVRVYDGSWAQWGRTADVTVA
jgi:thiosulfate/3-mercaptopyruvate sulfurtransferase